MTNVVCRVRHKLMWVIRAIDLFFISISSAHHSLARTLFRWSSRSLHHQKSLWRQRGKPLRSRPNRLLKTCRQSSLKICRTSLSGGLLQKVKEIGVRRAGITMLSERPVGVSSLFWSSLCVQSFQPPCVDCLLLYPVISGIGFYFMTGVLYYHVDCHSAVAGHRNMVMNEEF